MYTHTHQTCQDFEIENREKFFHPGQQSATMSHIKYTILSDSFCHVKIAQGWFHQRGRRGHQRLNQLSRTQTAQPGSIQQISRIVSPLAQHKYSLRHRVHSFMLHCKDDKNFISRVLLKHCSQLV